MRTPLLLLLMCFVSVIHAKKKTENHEVQNTQLSHPTLVNVGSSQFHENDIFGPIAMRTPNHFSSINEAVLGESGSFVISDHFFNVSENSYSDVLSESGSSGMNSEHNYSLIENASLDAAGLFRQGMFYGFAAMLVLLNLTCFFLFEEKPFLYYSLCLAGFALLLFFSDGFSELFFVDFVSSLALETTLLTIAIGLHAVFASKFLTLKEFAPKLKWVTLFMITVATIACAFEWITNETIFSQIAHLSLFAIAASYFLTGVSLFSRKNYAKFYVIATFIPLLFSVDFFILRPMGIEFLGTDGGHVKAAAIAEMIILTYGIMYRMQAVKEENELRQLEMRIFLKRQEVLTARKKTEKLVEDVYLENLIMHYDLDGLEIKLLQYISEGKDNTKIARKLKTSVVEIEELTKELYKKLEIGEQVQQDYRLVDQQPDYIYN
jgi:DNA-binding CsgD family transcriptional regulator